MSKKEIVVTGGFGFIGSRFVCSVLKHTDYNVKIIDKMTYAADKGRVFDNIDDNDRRRIQHLNLDICDVTPINLRNAEYVVNFAAESHVDNSIDDGEPFIKSNVMGVYNLLECAKKIDGLKKFIQISTDEVYGDMADLRGRQSSDESFKLRPSSYYSASKASADLLVESAARTFGIPYIITRSCNNFGPDQDPEKLIPKIFDFIQRGKDVPIYGDGLQSREWIHVDDNVNIILELLLSSATNEIYNIGSGYNYKNLGLVQYIGEFLDTPVSYNFVEDRLGHDRAYRLNTKKVNAFLGERTYQPLEGFLKDEARRIKSNTYRG